MSLAAAVAGAIRPSQEIAWVRADGTVENLTGATITGKLRSKATQQVSNISGALTVTNGAAGTFVWSYSLADVATAGEYFVQFTATFASQPTPARTLVTDWSVNEAL